MVGPKAMNDHHLCFGLYLVYKYTTKSSLHGRTMVGPKPVNDHHLYFELDSVLYTQVETTILPFNGVAVHKAEFAWEVNGQVQTH